MLNKVNEFLKNIIQQEEIDGSLIDERNHYLDGKTTDENKKITFDKIYADLVRQIEREDGLMNTRINLLLIFQGFLFNAFTNIAKETQNLVAQRFLLVIPVIALLVAVLAWLGIYGASQVLIELKKTWITIFKDTAYIKPFGDDNFHGLAMIYNYGIPSILVVIWGFIIIRLYV